MGIKRMLARWLGRQSKTEAQGPTPRPLALLEANADHAVSRHRKAVAAGMQGEIAVLIADVRAEINKSFRSGIPPGVYLDMCRRGLVPTVIVPLPRETMASSLGQYVPMLKTPAPADAAGQPRFWVVGATGSGFCLVAAEVGQLVEDAANEPWTGVFWTGTALAESGDFAAAAAEAP